MTVMKQSSIVAANLCLIRIVAANLYLHKMY